MTEALMRSRHSRHSGTQGTSSVLRVPSAKVSTKGHSGTQGNWRAHQHSGTQSTWAFGTLGYSKGAWALGYLRQSDTRRALWHLALEGHLNTRTLRHLGTRGTLFSKLTHNICIKVWLVFSSVKKEKTRYQIIERAKIIVQRD